MKAAGETIDGLLRNKIRVIQSRKGYRVSEDAVLLTWFTNAQPSELILDAGTGCGAIAFGIAYLKPSTIIVGLEIQEEPALRAARGVILNGLQERVLVIRGDLRQADSFFRHDMFHAVVSNPPYYEPGRGRINLQEEKALSRHQMMMPLEDLVRVSSRLLTPTGRLSLIYPASGLPKIKKSLLDAGFRIARMLWIHSHEDSDPGLVCIEARKNCTLTLQCKLVLYESAGKRTHVAEAILSGELHDLDGPLCWTEEPCDL